MIETSKDAYIEPSEGVVDSADGGDGQKNKGRFLKRNVYLGDYTEEIEGESKRQGRSPSWLIRRAWLRAKDRIKRIPSA